MSCWEKYKPNSIKITAEIIKASELISDVYYHHGAGGSLHVVVDDWNIESHNVQFCEEWMESHKDEIDPKRLSVERACIKALKALSDDDRAIALALHDGFLEVNR